MKKIKQLFLSLIFVMICGFATAQVQTFTVGPAFKANTPSYLQVKDLNNDTFPEIITGTSNQVKIYFNDTLTFLTATTYVPATQIVGLSLNSINNNIYLLNKGIKQNASKVNLVTMTNNGSGVFTTTSSATQYSPYSTITGFFYEDYDTNTVKDIIVSTGLNNVVTVGIQLATPKTVAMGTQTLRGVTAFTAYDAKNDTLIDIAAVFSSGYGLSVRLQNSSHVFATSVQYALNEKYSSIAVGDVTGDAIDDIVVTDFVLNKVVIWKGAANGTLTKLQSFTTGSNPQGVAVGDLDKDGKNDIIVYSYGLDKILTYIRQ